MRTLRRLLYAEVISAVAFVGLGFLALFYFFDVVDQLPSGMRAGDAFPLAQVLLYATLLLPNHLYELLPIAVLIGTIFVMARLAQSSEYTILRTSGLGPWRALRTLLLLGLGFAALTFAVGDYVAPVSERSAQLLRASQHGRLSIGATGAWIKEGRGDSAYTVNVGGLSPQGHLRDVRIFEANAQGLLQSVVQAESGTFAPDRWSLTSVERTQFLRENGGHNRVLREHLDALDWPTAITAEMVSATLLKPDRMRTLDLYRYIRHLAANGQTSQRYEIEFWRKVFYPLSCLVMVVLALPFAYLHFRGGGITGYVFFGVMVGISFFLLNNVFGHIGNLRAWSPWLAAAAPGLIYSLASLAAFGWLVLRR